MLRSSRSAPTSHDPEPDLGPRDHSFFSSCSGGGREIQHILAAILVLDSFFQRFSMVSSDFCYRVLIEE
ncbi:hypothetical protein MRB53_016913 [Persea americana]|uniref:Uncharacterized protein n=1 Tax=Persea americana TaxID=3435 RepID=A0ACC2M3P4_PERAE|nr:hypothetical protein MRB53_016913 [Persea americana]